MGTIASIYRFKTHSSLNEILDYFEQRYSGKTIRGKRVPFWPSPSATVFDRKLEQQNTSSNSLEAFNNVITKRNLDNEQPGHFVFPKTLKKGKNGRNETAKKLVGHD